VGTVASLYKLKETERDGWFKSEKTICSKFYSFYRNLLGKDPDFYANCALYLEKAQEQAHEESTRLLTDAKKQIEVEKQNAIRDIRVQVAELSVQIAEKVLREKLSSDEQQMRMINRLLDEVSEAQSKD